MSKHLNSDLRWMSFWDITLTVMMALPRNAGANLSPPPGGSWQGACLFPGSKKEGIVPCSPSVCVCVGGGGFLGI